MHSVTFNTAPALPCAVGKSPWREWGTEGWVIGWGVRGEGWGVGENILEKEIPVRGNPFLSKMVLVHLENKNAFK